MLHVRCCLALLILVFMTFFKAEAFAAGVIEYRSISNSDVGSVKKSGNVIVAHTIAAAAIAPRFRQSDKIVADNFEGPVNITNLSHASCDRLGGGLSHGASANAT